VLVAVLVMDIVPHVVNIVARVGVMVAAEADQGQDELADHQRRAQEETDQVEVEHASTSMGEGTVKGKGHPSRLESPCIFDR
jgi:hypothetical protein